MQIVHVERAKDVVKTRENHKQERKTDERQVRNITKRLEKYGAKKRPIPDEAKAKLRLLTNPHIAALVRNSQILAYAEYASALKFLPSSDAWHCTNLSQPVSLDFVINLSEAAGKTRGTKPNA